MSAIKPVRQTNRQRTKAATARARRQNTVTVDPSSLVGRRATEHEKHPSSGDVDFMHDTVDTWHNARDTAAIKRSRVRGLEPTANVRGGGVAKVRTRVHRRQQNYNAGSAECTCRH